MRARSWNVRTSTSAVAPARSASRATSEPSSWAPSSSPTVSNEITRRSRRRSSARDVPLQLRDLLLLRLDHALDEVTDREHADDLAVADDRQVADPLLGHQH